MIYAARRHAIYSLWIAELCGSRGTRSCEGYYFFQTRELHQQPKHWEKGTIVLLMLGNLPQQVWWSCCGYLVMWGNSLWAALWFFAIWGQEHIKLIQEGRFLEDSSSRQLVCRLICAPLFHEDIGSGIHIPRMVLSKPAKTYFQVVGAEGKKGKQ